MIPRMLPLAFALFAVAGLTACASSRTLGHSVTDLSANATLKSVLLADRNYDYSDIDMTIYEGRLMLTGTMRSDHGRRKLVENAWKADSVDQVIDEVFVGDKTPFRQGLEDTRIDQAVKTKLIGARDVTSADFKIAVSSSEVFVIGKARDQKQLERVLNIARTTSGVKKVVSHIVYKDYLTPRG